MQSELKIRFFVWMLLYQSPAALSGAQHTHGHMPHTGEKLAALNFPRGSKGNLREGPSRVLREFSQWLGKVVV